MAAFSLKNLPLVSTAARYLRRFRVKFLAGLLVVTTILSLAGFVWWTGQLSPVNPQDLSRQSFIIPVGQSAIATTTQLQSRGLIRSGLAARIYLQVTRLDQKIKAGTYLLSPSLDLKSQLLSLTSGPRDIWITIPEGWRREQIAARLAANLQDFDAEKFVQLTASREGRLFPDTYLIPTYAAPADIVQIMTTNFITKVGSIDSQSLILASLVEREANSSADRPVIAGILGKRLKAGWPLQVDATVQYARGNWSPITDTRYPSIYNTYIHLGLPPTPIANPGLASINAVRTPQTTPYWFYLHTPDGKAYFARTIEEHNLNIDKYLRP